MRQVTNLKTIFSAKTATGVGLNIDVQDFRHAVVMIDGTGTAAGTVKCVGSIGSGAASGSEDTAPDFTAAQSLTNSWDYINMIAMIDGLPVAGSDGMVFSANAHQIFTVNVDALKWLNFNLTARTGGSFTVKVKLYND